MELWSSEKFFKLIESAQIEDILKTPFMMEIVVQVLPSLRKNYSDASQYKEQFIKKFIEIKKSTEEENKQIQKYQEQRLAQQGYPQISATSDNEVMDFEQKTKKAQQIWDQLQDIKIFQNFSLVDKISKNELNQIDETSTVIRALIIKQLTVFDFYMTFVKFYHQQQIKKYQELGRMINEESFMIDLFNFSQSLAINLTINELSQIKYIQKGQLDLQFVKYQTDPKENWLDAYFNDFESYGEYKKLIRSCTLLTQKGGNYSFTHKSIQEFLVGHFLLNFLDKLIIPDDFETKIKSIKFDKNNQKTQEQKQINVLEQFCYKLSQEIFNQNTFNLSTVNYKGVLSLIKDEMKLKSDLKPKLIPIVCLSKVSKEYIRAASNSLFLLSYNNEYLQKQNFENIKISDIELIGLSLYGSDLSNSQFTNVSLSCCNFSKCDLKNINWIEMKCDELPAQVLMEYGGQRGFIIDIFQIKKNVLLSLTPNYVSFWDVTYGQIFNQQQIPDYFRLENVRISPNQLLLALLLYKSKKKKSYIQILEYENQNKLIFQTKTQNVPESIIFSHDSILLAISYCQGSEIAIYNIYQNKTEFSQKLIEKTKSILFTQNDEILICLCEKEISLWNIKKQEKIGQLIQKESKINDFGLSNDDITLALALENDIIQLWNIKTRKLICNLKEKTKNIKCLKFLSSGDRLVSWGEDRLLQIWNTKQGKLIGCIERLFNEWNDPVWFLQNDQILAFQNTNEIQFWDVQKQKKISTLGGQSSKVQSLVLFQSYQNQGIKILGTLNEYSNVIHLWDFKTSQTITQLDGHQSEVLDVGFSPEGSMIYSYGSDNTIRLWTVKDGKHFLCQKNIPNCNYISFSNKGEYIIIQGDSINLWYFKENRKITLKEDTFSSSTTETIEVSTIGLISMMLSPPNQNQIKIFDINIFRDIGILQVKSEKVTFFEFSPNGYISASIDDGDFLQIWDAKSLKELFYIQNVKGIKFSPDSQVIAASRSDETVVVYNLKGIELFVIDDVYKIEFLKQNNSILATITGKKIRFWSTLDGKLILELKQSFKCYSLDLMFINDESIFVKIDKTGIIWLILINHEGSQPLKCIEGIESQRIIISQKCQLLVLVSINKSKIVIWNYVKNEQIAQEYFDVIMNAIFSPNEEILACYCKTQVKLWVVSPWKEIYYFILPEQEKLGQDFVFSPDSHYFCFSHGSYIRIFNLKEEKEIKYLHCNSDVSLLAFTQNDSIFISYSKDDQCILLWDAQKRKCLNGIRTTQNKILLSNDDKILAYNRRFQNEIRLYNSESGDLIKRFQENIFIQKIVFSPDSKFIASCNSDFTVKLRSITNGELIHQFEYDNQIKNLQFSPDSTYLAFQAHYFIKVQNVNHQKNEFFELQQEIEDRENTLKQFVFAPNSDILYFLKGESLFLWNFKEEQKEFKMGEENYDSKTEFYGFIGNGTKLLLLSSNNVWIINIVTNIVDLKVYVQGQKLIQVSLDSKNIIIISKKELQIWNVQKKQIMAIFDEHTNEINQMALSPDSRIIASCSDDGTIKLTEIDQYEEENLKTKQKLISYKTLAVSFPITCYGCLIEGAKIQSSRGYDLVQQFSKKGAVYNQEEDQEGGEKGEKEGDQKGD